MIVLGYDPGGRGTHGVAAIEVDGNGAIRGTPRCDVVEDAAAAWNWLTGRGTPAALGIDTLLAWSLSGSRACDNALRRRYRAFGASVIPQNALYSSMTLNGAMVARRAADRGWPLFESHPKLLIRVLGGSSAAEQGVRSWYDRVKSGHDGTAKGAKRADDRADALVAAWCAAQGALGRWRQDLFEIPDRQLDKVAGNARFPWPEAP